MSYTGTLAPKKKEELQEIAAKLSLDSNGTKVDLANRIRVHLDAHDLSEDPVFAGLYTKKKAKTGTRSEASEEESPIKRKTSTKRKHTPPPLSNGDGALAIVSPPSSPLRDLIAKAIPDTQTIVKAAEKTGNQLQRRTVVAVERSREFLSNATNLTSVTVLLEFLFILYTVIPWQYYKLDVPVYGTTKVPYAPLQFLLSTWIYKELAFWFIPSVLAPQLAGTLISFTTPRKDVDPLSASIVKLALAVLVPEAWFIVRGRVVSQWRVGAAATALAFAVAEAVQERRVVVH